METVETPLDPPLLWSCANGEMPYTANYLTQLKLICQPDLYILLKGDAQYCYRHCWH